VASNKKVLVAGASGLVGSAAIRLFAAREDWEVVAVSRRPPLEATRAKFIAVDLADEKHCREALAGISDVTHLVYAAVNEQPDNIVAGWFDAAQIEKNAAMLVNLLEPILASSPGFKHISLVHGAKAYGSHLAQARVSLPYKESLPRVSQDNFYYRQEDYIAARQKGQSWSWTVFRPVMIFGAATGSNMNVFLVLAVLAALRKEAGLDLPMPAGRSAVVDACDSDMIAEALEWAASSEAARNEAFNLVNGDIFRMHDAFPVVAESMGMPLGAPTAYDIVQEIRRLADLWPVVVRKYKLQASEDLDQLLGASLQLAGGWTYDLGDGDPLGWGLTSTIKIRQAGFNACMESTEMMRKYIRRYQELRILPPS
jgi:nucleoside-diphosphate-sugar epimerase